MKSVAIAPDLYTILTGCYSDVEDARARLDLAMRTTFAALGLPADALAGQIGLQDGCLLLPDAPPTPPMPTGPDTQIIPP